MFDAALSGDATVVRRIAATLVDDGDAPRVAEELAAATEWVALRFVQAPLAQRD
ncbi:hypothetical protein J2Y58_000310 [Sphingomonas sp. BE138]|uniref:hypothetical protein n=1 Tax=Sphingomonas sp. BE138 TaxID=2817845 RepID=UPI0028610D40|nr:hypothetical protein [Sphingomonas sp. BE138]MDR6786972.1 hypothetical protein [Sphingomonas sp. BE138]